MSKFKEWFEGKLTVGPIIDDSQELDFKYNAVINLSERFPKYGMDVSLGFVYFWLPMNQVKKDIGLNSLAAALKILWECEKKNWYVYLHCRSGVNRSQAVRQAYYYMRTGQHLPGLRPDKNWENELIRNCVRGYLPPQREMEQFIYELYKVIEEEDIQLDSVKKKTINNF